MITKLQMDDKLTAYEAKMKSFDIPDKTKYIIKDEHFNFI